jgi:hypothetical protein
MLFVSQIYSEKISNVLYIYICVPTTICQPHRVVGGGGYGLVLIRANRPRSTTHTTKEEKPSYVTESTERKGS